ncbi:MAG: hypothetical protein CMO82_11015 [Winogradskyella sp.]|nr:hypothetical protein [Winogradskyella sp.]
MKTNIIKLTQLYGMHLHTDEKEAEKEAVKVDYLLSTYLPYGYVKDAQEKLKSENRIVSDSIIRQVKNLHFSDLQILNILIELAKNNKAIAEANKQKFKKLLSNT